MHEIWSPEAYEQFADKVVGLHVRAGGEYVGQVTSATLVHERGCKVTIDLFPPELPDQLEFIA